MQISDYEKNYLTQTSLLEHSRLVSDLSLKLFSKLLEYFPFLLEFNSKKDLEILKYSALLHDIGVLFENKMDKSHHKIGRDLILKNGIDTFDENSNLIIANIVRYHRRAVPSEKHKYYAVLDEKSKEKVNVFSSIVRLCDAVDFGHLNMVDDFEVEFNKNSNTLTINLGVNIMLNIGHGEILNKKKQLFEKTFNVEVLFA